MCNLKKHAQDSVKEQLFEAMVDGMGDAEKEIHEIFPELEGRRLEDELKGSEEYLYDRFHEWGEVKVAQFAPILQVIEQRAEQMTKDTNIPPEKRAEMREDVFNEFLEGFIDRMKYELIPELGDEPVKLVPAKKGGDR